MFARLAFNTLVVVLALAVTFPSWLPARSIEAATQGSQLPWPEPKAKAVDGLLKELKKDLPADRFRFTSVGPWVIATDLDAAGMRRFVDATIRVYAAAIQRQLFTKKFRKDPVKVYLFKDAKSYMAWNVRLFGERPGTPYGYYSRSRNALVMNIGTGGGTLLHEMVHAMAEPDFPDIPAWLNEGLGSLFEASSRNHAGKVVGVTNWRLTGLQKDLSRRTAPKFKDLLVMNDETFYHGEKSGSNYAASRYLMQWLQAQGKLEVFYTRIRDKKDPDAVASLRAVFKNRLSLKQIENRCYAWVKVLRR